MRWLYGLLCLGDGGGARVYELYDGGGGGLVE